MWEFHLCHATWHFNVLTSPKGMTTDGDGFECRNGTRTGLLYHSPKSWEMRRPKNPGRQDYRSIMFDNNYVTIRIPLHEKVDSGTRNDTPHGNVRSFNDKENLGEGRRAV
jgi:hypothetical protein